MYMSVHVSTVPVEARRGASDAHGAGFIGSCEFPDMGAGTKLWSFARPLKSKPSLQSP